MKKQTEQNLTISDWVFGIISIIILLFVTIVFVYILSGFVNDWFEEQPNTNFTKSCYDDDGTLLNIISNEKDCAERKKIRQEQQEEIKLADELGKDIGCKIGYFIDSCLSGDKKFQWSSSEKNWIETKESKRCSKYGNSKKEDVIVACLNYWNLTK